MPRIGGQFLYPFAQHVLLNIQIVSRLGNRHPALPVHPYRLKLELAGKLHSLH